MAHKTLIDGTEREIIGGKTLINGTEHEIVGGKALINGTDFDIEFRNKYTVTIASAQNNYLSKNAQIQIDNETYIIGNFEIKVAEGSVITCIVTGTSSMGMSDSGTGRIIVNGVEVVRAYGCTKTYDYVVKGDVSIHLDTMKDILTASYGIITITEE